MDTPFELGGTFVQDAVEDKVSCVVSGPAAGILQGDGIDPSR